MNVMTVADLKAALEDLPDNYEVWTAQGQGSKGVVGRLVVDTAKRRALLP
jgi:hypothetical protein